MSKKYAATIIIVFGIIVGFSSSAVAEIDDKSYIRDAYTGDAPVGDEFINQSATRVFSLSDTVWLYVRWHAAKAGNYTIVFLVTNTAGQSVLIDTAADAPAAAGGRLARKSINFNVAGSYQLSIVGLGPLAEIFASPEWYHFIVE